MSIALLGSDPVWQELLRQEGVAFSLSAPDLPQPPDILVIDRTPKLAEVAWLRRFAGSGGSVMAYAPDAQAIWRGVQCRAKRITSILPDDSTLFRNVDEVHVNARCWVPSGATCGTASGRAAVFAGRIEGSDCVLLPFDAGRLLTGLRSAARAFPARTPRPVFERTAAVSRGEVRRLAANGLRFLSARRGIPYVRLGYVPSGHVSAFGFRVDTDDDGIAALQPVADLARQFGARFTWFLAVRALLGDLSRAVQQVLAGQDVQYHCFRHLVYGDYKSNLADFTLGLGRLRKSGAKPAGAAAPYGEWNENWDRAAAASGITYSSEFCIGYDDLPFRPVGSEVLQVPVHPICSSRLLAAGADESELVDYFRRYAESQAARLEPCFLYDHPGKLMRVFESMRTVLQRSGERCGGWTTMTDYAAWWQERERVRYDWSLADDELAIDVEQTDGQVSVIVERPDSTCELPLEKVRRRIDRLDWQPLPEPFRFDLGLVPTMTARWRAQAGEVLRGIRRARQKRMEAGL